MKSLKSMLASACCAALLAPSVQATPFTFTLDLLPPGGMVSGAPGQLVGWGYTLNNTDVVNWFVPTQLSASSFALGTPDASYFDFPILGPGLGATVAFNPGAGQGLFGLLLNPGALPGQSESGQFTLAGEWWNGDPLGGGALLQPSDQVLAPFTVQVTGGSAPEPATWPLVLPGLLWLLFRPSLTPVCRRCTPSATDGQR
ncbi:hypothetical protein GCM10027277_41580 [Pseudoduganella ginsengisoli]|uniref:hypothetical protein n=1 Tax=Pseudoduganella ginsengisoli TaxID=1462440 RepID=UPI001BAB6384|nr:hypothetical protein [Pseudoduganella ginsengisoli]